MYRMAHPSDDSVVGGQLIAEELLPWEEFDPVLFTRYLENEFNFNEAAGDALISSPSRTER